MARDTTTTNVKSAIMLSIIINILARRVSGRDIGGTERRCRVESEIQIIGEQRPPVGRQILGCWGLGQIPNPALGSTSRPSGAGRPDRFASTARKTSERSPVQITTDEERSENALALAGWSVTAPIMSASSAATSRDIERRKEDDHRALGAQPPWVPPRERHANHRRKNREPSRVGYPNRQHVEVVRGNATSNRSTASNASAGGHRDSWSIAWAGPFTGTSHDEPADRPCPSRFVRPEARPSAIARWTARGRM